MLGVSRDTVLHEPYNWRNYPIACLGSILLSRSNTSWFRNLVNPGTTLISMRRTLTWSCRVGRSSRRSTPSSRSRRVGSGMGSSSTWSTRRPNRRRCCCSGWTAAEIALRLLDPCFLSLVLEASYSRFGILAVLRVCSMYRVGLVVWYIVGLTLMFHHFAKHPANSAIFPSAQAELGRQWTDLNQTMYQTTSSIL